jgi:long-chain acyl-CoA synthetase
MSGKPWLGFYEGIPETTPVPDQTMYEALAQAAQRWPGLTALTYLGRAITYAALIDQVDSAAAAFRARGITVGDSVVLSLPNVPQAVICFYALNQVGARAVMTHPLSSPEELKHYVRLTGARWAVTVDLFYPVWRGVAQQTGLRQLVVGRIPDYLDWPMRIGYWVTQGRSIPPLPRDDPLVLTWRDFMASQGARPTAEPARAIEPDQVAVILFSGGTTDLPKGIELTSANFNALAVSINEISGIAAGDSVLAILPVFHGFGLGLCVHTCLVMGGNSILVPQFSPEIYIKNLVKHSPAYIAGVPTLFQGLLSRAEFATVRFDKLKGAYSGGDTLTSDLKRRFDEAIMAQGSRVELMEGYGLTECVTACAVSPRHHYRDGSMGIPMTNMEVIVVDPDTGQEVAVGQEGEFCVTGPTLMKGYVDDPEATAHALRQHADGRTWLHTGDIGRMDADGFLYFLGRIKRLVKVSGVSVYPAQVEQVLESHPGVNRACVIGVPDPHQMHALKAFLVLGPGQAPSEQVRAELIDYCRQHLIKWAVPRHIEFREALPTTKVGKIAYTELEAEELATATGSQD